MNFAKSLTTAISYNTPKRLLLENQARFCQGLKVIHSTHIELMKKVELFPNHLVYTLINGQIYLKIQP